MGRSYFEVLKRASSFLEEVGKEGYAIQYLFLERKGWSKTDWLLHMRDAISAEEEQRLEADLAQLLTDYPPQYLLGYSGFYGHRFSVTEHTLIPRPETEELVEYCLEENGNKELTVVDVGTGTGAIAVSLKLARPAWQVKAVDLSEEALKVAEKNSERLGAAVEFFLGNGLAPVNGHSVDILISNPPYISTEEWALMDESVRKYEPHLALLAEENGLAVYRQLIEEAKSCLVSNGKIYFEIGFQQGEAVKKMIQTAFPEKRIRIKKDLSGKDRMVIAD
ncbi:peptide chain release factor N(5)-glutamine methyltransferase [Enterococcus sp. BWT-B8]|uniref:peptide chain release factor N(5)-glutamine methyltransferase n=1 Tax=Enterococcus sp. BWT-B8 TaxID=2885157 RepID=UPI001E31E828|nr:peptide chain release factor N(5)-glutamine methyltransferase [Enterococcus sp. BWT-B8]MCB5951853.1 peptide chain release factor N(5)-glutamine methyltransferase [Enterococcus sp. BWT-B8]